MIATTTMALVRLFLIANLQMICTRPITSQTASAIQIAYIAGAESSDLIEVNKPSP